jgi:hypothetical protein
MPAVYYCPRQSPSTPDLSRAVAAVTVTERRVTLPPPMDVMRAKIMGGDTVRKWGGRDE